MKGKLKILYICHFPTKRAKRYYNTYGYENFEPKLCWFDME